jgi:peptidoglycan/LPS O-acetylase OafA/YrhL
MDLHKNNFDSLRIALALIVVGAHLADVTGRPEFQVFRPFFDSDFAVKAFFAISGFLVMRSYASGSSLGEFAEKRIRRIYPAYLCAVLLCLVIGGAMTTLPMGDFVSSMATWKYLAFNAAFLNFLHPTLPGVFESNPMPAMDGALWTLKIEVALYLCVPCIFWLFKRLRPLPVAVGLTAVSVAWAYFFLSKGSAELARQFPGQLSYFVLGSLLAMDGRVFGKVGYITVASGLAYWAVRGTVLDPIVQPFFYASLTIFLATAGRIHVPAGRYGDVSYGIYLYHFPIIQALYALGAFANPWPGAAEALVLTLAAAYLSWHLVERPILRR